MSNRRNFLLRSLSGITAFGMSHGMGRGFANSLARGSKRCIILWMDGGPSQLETFDPKPGAANGGPTQSIASNVPGTQFSEHLPKLATHASDLCVIRSLTSREGQHDRAKYVNHTGFAPIAAFPRPELGSLFAHAGVASELPGFVTLGGQGYGPAYLGDRFAPFAIGESARTIALLKQLRSKSAQFQLLDKLSQPFDEQFTSGRVKQRRNQLQSVEGLLDSRLAEILDTDQEPAAIRRRYGQGDFASRLLSARRLLEGGVTCVEVQLGGWDTHQNNFAACGRLCGQLDQPFAALIDDLKASGLWEETLLVWLGDFGRTPVINGNSGRDHFPRVSNAVLAGAGLEGGQLIGKTTEDGMRITEGEVSIADLFATILHRIGVAPDEEYQTSFGSPTEATDGGKVIPSMT